MSWNTRLLPDLRGRSAVVTGGTSGIGFFVAEQLASAGAHVTLAGRSPERTRAAVAALARSAPDVLFTSVRLDLADLESVREAADTIRAAGPLDILVNNAGVTAAPRRAETRDGFELMLGTNHLGPFALTLQLLPALVSAGPARVVSLGSLTHTPARIDFDDLHGQGAYRSMRAYGRSKLAALLFAFELDRRLRAAGSAVSSLAAHPGWAVDGLTPARPPMWEPSPWLRRRGRPLAVVAQGKDRGAWSVVRAASDPDAQGGQYFGPSGPGSLRGLPAIEHAADHAYDPAAGARLWEVSEALTGVHWEQSLSAC
ncbi:oxidoreductase [Streptomyces sp. NPDC001568]|uniref:oxidoreductase n=1 Tax=Streptomyces sp. NPDC001568 TaxID=3364588 RepID=UPI0036A5CCA9